MLSRFLSSLRINILACVCVLAAMSFISQTALADTYVVCVGINRYKNATMLHLCEGDAKAMAAICKQLPGSHVVLITGRYATLANINKVIKAHFAKAKSPDDSLIFYFSGHGAPSGFATYDSPSTAPGDLLQFSSLAAVMKTSPARRKIIFSDSCFSGASRHRTSDGSKRHRRSDPNVILFMSSRANETSIESSALPNSIFTHHLINGLSGSADANLDHKISAREIFNYVSHRVIRDSNRRQHPVMWGNFDQNLTISTY